MRRFFLRLPFLLMVLAACQPTPAPSPQPTRPPQTQTFQPSNANFLNPERGFFLPMDLIGTDDFGSVRAAGYTLIRSYVRLDAYREQDLPQPLLDALDKALNAVRAGGIKVILRFSYNFGPYPNSEPDASKAQMLRHIAQLAPALQKHADVIAWMEAGFVGAWGEWHTSTHGIDKSLSDKREIVSALLQALPPTRQIQLRYPTDLIRMFPEPLSEQTAFSASEQARIGHHNDCFLASDTDQGTYEREGSNTRESDQKYLAQSTRFTVVGGETCGENPPRTDCEATLKEMALLHFTEINLSYHPQVVRTWRKQKCFDEIVRLLGYRLSLKSATLPTELKQGESFSLSVELENTGFASPINPRPLFVVLDGPQRIVLPVPNVDPRRWGPGVHVVSATLAVPASALAGSYRLALWLPDAAESLQGNPQYAIQLANEGMWNEAIGLNVIANEIKIE